MPNHVMNNISLQGDEYKIKEMLEAIKSDKFGLGTIDFNKIIPMPESLNIEAGSRTDKGLKYYKDFIETYTLSGTINMEKIRNIPVKSEEEFLRERNDIPRDEWELGKTAWYNMQKYGAPTWYEWSVINWNTKWNAYGYDKNTDYSKNDSLTFQTAWTAPHPIIEKLAQRYPELYFEHEWADEDIGHNCGRYSYRDGQRVEEFQPESQKEAVEFACRIWAYEPEDLDLCLNSTETKYINRELEEYEVVELFGKPALFANERLNEKDIPQGMYCYHLREDGYGQFCSIERKVGVNHGGTVITREPINLGKEGCLSLTEDTSPNFLGESMTLGEFMETEFKQEDGQEEDELQFGGMQI